MQAHKMQLLRKNICFPYINNKNFPKLSFKIVILLQPEPRHSNLRELSASSDAALFLAAFWSSFLFCELCLSHPVPRCVSRKGSLAQASFSEALLLHSFPLLLHHMKEVQSAQGGEIHHGCSAPFYYNPSWQRGQKTVWALHSLTSQNLGLQLTNTFKPTFPSTISLQHSS